jgi:hypothetical protein
MRFLHGALGGPSGRRGMRFGTVYLHEPQSASNPAIRLRDDGASEPGWV